MNQRCPKCGHTFKGTVQQSKAAKARWRDIPQQTRSAEMRRIALIRHAKQAERLK